MSLVLQPMQAAQRACFEARGAAGTRGAGARPCSGRDKLAAVYDFLRKARGDHRLAGQALRHRHRHRRRAASPANYKTQTADGRLERYEIVLPVAGSYAQIREFLKRSLAEIPVLSLDQITLKRENRHDGAVQAELRLTLHMVKS